MLYHKRLVLTLGLILFSSASHAIVNMENLHTLKPASGFSGQFDLTLNGSGGSTDKKEYGLATRLQWHQPERHTSFLLLDGSYGELNGVKNTEKGFIHGRHIRPLNGTLDGEIFAQAEHNRFARLTLRTLAGGGARLSLIDNPQQGLIIAGLGAFWSREEIDDSYPDAGIDTLWRANTYLVAKYLLSPTAQLTNTLYYQPAFDDSSDYRLIDQFGLSLTVTESIRLSFKVDHAYDSQPPMGVDNTQMSYTTSLSLHF